MNPPVDGGARRAPRGLVLLAVACAGVSLAACDRSSATSSGDATASQNDAAVPAGLFVDAAPSGARDVIPAKQQAQAGESIVVHGRIGGSRSPFVEGRAIFTLADMSLPPCSDNPDDACATPWDYCCEPVDKLMKGTITVQVADEAGAPLRVTLESRGGLRPLAEVTVEGRIAQKTGDSAMVLNASRIFVGK
ncbi:MAG: hypothetical protein DCC65_07030 [Planctomycetota bacterium]|nr:MAG: hypothetical protein DCC65_07030 [Planctomycetota bacterium]